MPLFGLIFDRERDTKRSAIRFQQYILLVIYMAMLGPLWGPWLVWLYWEPESEGAANGLMVTLMFCVPISLWCAAVAGHYMAAEFQSFRVATLRALSPLLLRLSFFPLIGPIFRRLALPRRRPRRWMDPEDDPD